MASQWEAITVDITEPVDVFNLRIVWNIDIIAHLPFQQTNKQKKNKIQFVLCSYPSIDIYIYIVITTTKMYKQQQFSNNIKNVGKSTEFVWRVREGENQLYYLANIINIYSHNQQQQKNGNNVWNDFRIESQYKLLSNVSCIVSSSFWSKFQMWCKEKFR